MTPAPNHAAQRAGFLDHLQRGGHAGYYWTVNSQGKKFSHWWNGTGRPEPPKTAGNLYFGVFPTTEIPTTNAKGEPRPQPFIRGRIAIIAALNCLFSEFDAKDYGDDLAATLATVERLTPRPSVVIASGGGYHCYWLLDQPWVLSSDADREHARRVLYVWIDYTGGDDSAKDLARVLRVPGSLNYKYTPPRPVEFVWCELDRLYTRDELIAHCEGTWARQKLDFAVDQVRHAPDGQKHRTLLRMAKLAGGVADILGDATVEDELYDAIENRADDPAQAARTIQDGIGYGRSARLSLADTPPALRASPPQPKAGQSIDRAFILECLNKDEAGDAQLVEALYRGQLLYDHRAKEWYIFTGPIWDPYPSTPRQLIWSQVAAKYLYLSAELQAEAERAADEAEKTNALKNVDRLIQRAKQLRSVRRVNNVLTFASELLAFDGGRWDSNPWVLGLANGVLDLQTGQLRPGRPDDYLRKVAPTAWAGMDAPAPRWERFISEVMSNEADRAAFLQRMLGYALNGTTKEHIVGICVGERGRNGKRVLFETLQHVLGPYAGAVSTDVIIGQDYKRIAGSAQPHLMSLQGRRIAYCSETGEYDRLNASQVKNVTGGDRIRARDLYAKDVEFDPSHTLFLQTNRKPQAPADDDALWERVKVIEFRARFVDEPQAPDERLRDPNLEDALQAEAPGILAWLVCGHLDWLQGGLRTPVSVKLARDTYRLQESIEPFLEAACHEAAELEAEGGAMYAAYESWCKAYRLRPKSLVWFGKELQKRFEKHKNREGRAVYYGVGLETTTFEPIAQPQPPASLDTPPQPLGALQDAVNGAKKDGLLRGCADSEVFSHDLPHDGKRLKNPSTPQHPSAEEVKPPSTTLAPGVEQPRIIPDRLEVDRGRIQELIDGGLGRADAERQAVREARAAAPAPDPRQVLAAEYERATGESLNLRLWADATDAELADYVRTVIGRALSESETECPT